MTSLGAKRGDPSRKRAATMGRGAPEGGPHPPDARLKAQADAIGQTHGIVEYGLDGAVRWANDRYLKIIGYRLGEIVGRSRETFVSQEDRDAPDGDVFWASLCGGAVRTATVRRIAAGGGEIWLRASWSPVKDEAGEVAGIVEVAADATAERREAARCDARAAALDRGLAVAELDLDGVIRNVNENFVALMGYARAEIVGRPHSDFAGKAEAGDDAYRALWSDLGKGAVRSGRFRRSAKSGRAVWIEATYSAILGADGAPGGVLETARDVTGEVEAREELAQRRQEYAENLRNMKTQVEKETFRDPLTGLANRRSLDLELESRLSDGDVVIISVDLDRFKQVNDMLGHEAGDHVLRHVARKLSEQIRKSDLAARVGGDEFIVLCARGTTEEEAVGIANRTLRALMEPVRFNNKRCLFGASFGIARCASRATCVSEILSYADAALYRAKGTGREKVELFTPELMEAVRRDRKLADDFAAALATGQIVPYVQTQHCAADWSLAGIEVLARWLHPERGVLAPDAFLHVVRQLGMESDLDASILMSAIREIEAVERKGVAVPRVSFNVSAGRILSSDFVDAVSGQIRSHRERYAFEILETVSYPEYENDLAFAVDSLRELGFQIDIDDFGSGYASINSILSVVPDSIKIDRHIIEPLGLDPRKTKMVALIVEIARVMGVRVTAEGVETRRQAELLRDFGCDTLQGFYFSRPMPIAELADFTLDRGEAAG